MTAPAHRSETSVGVVVDMAPLDFEGLLPAVFSGASFGNIEILEKGRVARASKMTPQLALPNEIKIVGEIDYLPLTPAGTKTRVTCLAYTIGAAGNEPNNQQTLELVLSLRHVAEQWEAEAAIRDREDLPHDPVVGPGERFEKAFTGALRDYSGCATEAELAGLTRGTFPLGSYAFGHEATGDNPGSDLFLSTFSNGAPMEYNGVLICAPQNSGKTVLLLRWARAAAKAEKPFSTFIIDVKGNLFGKLKDNIEGNVYFFTTDPHDDTSDRINFLSGPTGLTAIDSDRIGQLATALLPSRGFVEKGGLDDFHYRNRVNWLKAFIHILKLAEHYLPEWFTEADGARRDADLGDLYALMGDERTLKSWCDAIFAEEKKRRDSSEPPPVCGIDFWVNELAIMLDPEVFHDVGQRVEKDTFRAYTIGLLGALEPFAPQGTLYARTRSVGVKGRLFDLETALSGADGPSTVILSARQQDLDKSEAVLALTIKRLQWFLFDRMMQPDAADRPVLLLLDETRRIRDFDPAEYITFAREAKAGCVVVYQSLDQIGAPEKITEILENVGTQIYLGSLVGNTAKYFIGILPKRWRPSVSHQVTRSANGETRSMTIGHEQVDYFSTTDLYNLPSARWPALVHINDLPRRKPFLTDMTDSGDLAGARGNTAYQEKPSSVDGGPPPAPEDAPVLTVP